MNLFEFMRTPPEERAGKKLELDVGDVPATAQDTLERLNKLGILTDTVLWNLIGQAPIDPAGLLAFCSTLGGFRFVPENFSAVKTLARDKETGVETAVMLVDVLSNDVIFLGKKGDSLVKLFSYSVAELQDAVKDSENREQALQTLLEDAIVRAVESVG